MLNTKIGAALLFSVMIISACGKKIVPEGSQNKTNSEKEKTAQATAEKKSVLQGASTGKATEEKAGMMGSGTSTVGTKQETTPPGTPPSGSQDASYAEKGSGIYSVKCSRCHAAKDPGNYTWSQWGGILKKMVPNAKLTSDEEDYVRAYIKANAKQ
ncbi:MAG: hypothetical protein U0U70_03020 [Chitinophagaceae bacterium]